MDEALALLTNSANFESLNRDGLNSLDFIFTKESDIFKEVLISVLGHHKFEEINKNYTVERMCEIKKVINSVSADTTKSHDYDTAADTTMVSRISEVIPSMETIDCEDLISTRMRELQLKVAESKKKVERLDQRNKQLKNKVRISDKKLKGCSESRGSEMDSMTNIVSKITSEINAFNNWIHSFRKTSEVLFDTVYNRVSSALGNYYGADASISVSGSYENGLLMPWSDLNIIVTLLRGGRHENKSRSMMLESVQKFSKNITTKNNFVENFTIEERSSLIILKLNMTKQYNNCGVEIIFKYYNNAPYPTNEETVIDYIARYPSIVPIYTVLRAMLHKLTLDDPSLNGLKSVAIVLMIVAYIQQLEYEGTCTSDISIGQLFLNFLFHYSYNFDYYMDSIQCAYSKEVSKSPFVSKNPHKRINALEVCNPYNADIILTKSFRRTCELRQMIKLCYTSIFSQCCCTLSKTMTVTVKLDCNDASKQKSLDRNVMQCAIGELEQFKFVNVNYDAQKPKKFIRKPLKKNAAVYEAKSGSAAKRVISTSVLNFERELSLAKPEQRNEPRLFVLQGLFNFRFETI